MPEDELNTAVSFVIEIAEEAEADTVSKISNEDAVTETGSQIDAGSEFNTATIDARREALQKKNRRMNSILADARISTKFFKDPSEEEIVNFLATNSRCGFTCKKDSAILKDLKAKYPRASHIVSIRPNRDNRLTDVTIECVSNEEISKWINESLARAAERGTRNATVTLGGKTVDEIRQFCESEFPRSDNFAHSIRAVAPGVYDVRIFDNRVRSTDLPSKKTLDHWFTTTDRLPGKPPAVHLIVKRHQVNMVKCQVYGYNFMVCKNQPEDIRLVSILVFQRDQA